MRSSRVIILIFATLLTESLGQKPSKCLLPKSADGIVQGNGRILTCAANFNLWSYDVQIDDCESFHYGGCGGNQNRFNTREACERECKNGSHLCGSFLDGCTEQLTMSTGVMDELILSIGIMPECHECLLPPDLGIDNDYLITPVYVRPSRNIEIFNTGRPVDLTCDDEDCFQGSGSGEETWMGSTVISPIEPYPTPNKARPIPPLIGSNRRKSHIEVDIFPIIIGLTTALVLVVIFIVVVKKLSKTNMDYLDNDVGRRRNNNHEISEIAVCTPNQTNDASTVNSCV